MSKYFILIFLFSSLSFVSKPVGASDLSSQAKKSAASGVAASLSTAKLAEYWMKKAMKAARKGKVGRALKYTKKAILVIAFDIDSKKTAGNHTGVSDDVCAVDCDGDDDEFCAPGDRSCREARRMRDEIRRLVDRGDPEVCLGTGEKRYPCLQIDENQKSLSATFSDGGKPILINELEKQMKTASKDPAMKKAIAKASKSTQGIRTRLDELHAEIDDLEKEKKNEKTASSEKDSSSSGAYANGAGSFGSSGAYANGAGSFGGANLGASAKKKKRRNHFKNLLSQFRANKEKKHGDQISISLGDQTIGIAQDNIFAMVHRRYQERKTKKEFLENSTQKTATQGIYLPL